jgi:hypothetical protein
MGFIKSHTLVVCAVVFSSHDLIDGAHALHTVSSVYRRTSIPIQALFCAMEMIQTAQDSKNFATCGYRDSKFYTCILQVNVLS